MTVNERDAVAAGAQDWLRTLSDWIAIPSVSADPDRSSYSPLSRAKSLRFNESIVSQCTVARSNAMSTWSTSTRCGSTVVWPSAIHRPGNTSTGAPPLGAVAAPGSSTTRWLHSATPGVSPSESSGASTGSSATATASHTDLMSGPISCATRSPTAPISA